jgi:AraC-like DNA-binding protein
MQIACELLEAGGQKVSTVANAVGYESESPFSAAFKRIMNCRPGVYQKNHQSTLNRKEVGAVAAA